MSIPFRFDNLVRGGSFHQMLGSKVHDEEASEYGQYSSALMEQAWAERRSRLQAAIMRTWPAAVVVAVLIVAVPDVIAAMSALLSHILPAPGVTDVVGKIIVTVLAYFVAFLSVTLWISPLEFQAETARGKLPRVILLEKANLGAKQQAVEKTPSPTTREKFKRYLFRHFEKVADMTACDLTEKLGVPCAVSIVLFREVQSSTGPSVAAYIAARDSTRDTANSKNFEIRALRSYENHLLDLKLRDPKASGFLAFDALDPQSDVAEPMGSTGYPATRRSSLALHTISCAPKTGSEGVVGFVRVESAATLSTSLVKNRLALIADHIYYALELLHFSLKESANKKSLANEPPTPHLGFVRRGQRFAAIDSQAVEELHNELFRLIGANMRSPQVSASESSNAIERNWQGSALRTDAGSLDNQQPYFSVGSRQNTDGDHFSIHEFVRLVISPESLSAAHRERMEAHVLGCSHCLEKMDRAERNKAQIRSDLEEGERLR